LKVLLDENLPQDLRYFLPGHDVFTVGYMGWASTKNGQLLSLAEAANFDVMLTKDSGVEYQQHLATLPISIVVIRSKTNKLDDIRPLLPELISKLASIRPKTLAHVG
jgi:predicted nuclease of predicted toxin-antitoxin system